MYLLGTKHGGAFRGSMCISLTKECQIHHWYYKIFHQFKQLIHIVTFSYSYFQFLQIHFMHFADPLHSLRSGTKFHLKKHSPTERANSHLNWHYLFKSQQNFQSCLKSNFLFTPILIISIKKFSRWLESLTIGRISLIGIYWYQSINRFINSHFLMYFDKGGLAIDPIIKPPLWECINKSENPI